MKFKTKSGSIYEINIEEMTWARLSSGPESGVLRTDGGKLLEWPVVIVGWEVRMYSSPAPSTPEGYEREIWTTEVVEILEYDDSQEQDLDKENA